MFYTILIKKIKHFINNLAVGETEEQAKLRFQVELEFVQCLANPNYLHCMYFWSYYIMTFLI